MQTINFSALENSWKIMEPVLKAPSTKKDIENHNQALNDLIDYTGGDENHPLAGLLELVGSRIEQYEDQHLSLPESSPVQVLRFLMDQHKLKQADLPEIGRQSVVSMILNGKRKLNANHIAALSKRFDVPADLFIEN